MSQSNDVLNGNSYKNFNIIDGFSFDNSCRIIKMTDDAKHIIATGNYPPQVR